ncbi:MAG TPA: phenylalanine--tRNA ligase subunit beta, partial [Candidatus Bathyarchaeia archaeon]|nr:phenylalanine--tRNA ligase subunit beta [Candidatus Bathyarchaeia archaeon]
MPVVTLYFDRIAKILGRKIPRDKVLSTIPFLGLDIEEETQDHVNIEYSPNRPDFSTDYGIIVGLQGLLGIKTGTPKLVIKKGKSAIKVNPSVGKVRPFITAIEARNGKLDDETIRQIITMQEDLHNGIGRRRKKASIGIHDLDKIRYPLVYNTATRTHKFVPLNSSESMTISDILEKTETGRAYQHLLTSSRVPIIVDSTGNTISFPPIINSKLTEVSANSKNLLVEITATDKNTAEDALAIISYTLQSVGFDLYSVKISGARNSTPNFTSKSMLLEPSFVNATLGLDLSQSEMVKSLRKSRLDAKIKGKNILCTIPRFRTDIFGPIDLVEEIALGYGIQNLEPTVPQSVSTGQKNKQTILLQAASDIMIGLGYSEVMNFGLGGKSVQYDLTGRDGSKMISVTDSKSQEHHILRDTLLPGMIDTLSRNIHEPYPQKIFEIGTVFDAGNPVNEAIHLGCLSAHNNANYTEIQSILQSFLKAGFNVSSATKTGEDALFTLGRTASVLVNGNRIGTVGEISSKIIDNFKLRIPVAGFEITLS